MDYVFQIGEVTKSIPILLAGLRYTVTISALGIVISFIGGWILALGKVSGRRIIPSIISGYIEFWRNTPFLVQVFFIYFGFTALTGLSFTRFQAGLITICLNSSAYNAEILRGGIRSVPKIQIEAARSLGLNSLQVWYRVIIPYVHRTTFPSLTNQAILVILGTSVLSVIAVPELLNQARQLVGITHRALEIFLVVTVMYAGLIISFSFAMKVLERNFFRLRH